MGELQEDDVSIYSPSVDLLGLSLNVHEMQARIQLENLPHVTNKTQLESRIRTKSLSLASTKRIESFIFKKIRNGNK